MPPDFRRDLRITRFHWHKGFDTPVVGNWRISRSAYETDPATAERDALRMAVSRVTYQFTEKILAGQSSPELEEKARAVVAWVKEQERKLVDVSTPTQVES